MRIGSVCSGIGCEAVAWAPIDGWQHVFFAEVAPFPRAVLKHRFPDVPLHGDFTTIGADTYGSIDLLVGGTPCQSFSVAGQRGGVDDERGNLAFGFLALARRLRPEWLVFENVPGFLSIDDGRSFGAFLGAMGELGYGFAYRVLDAQFVRIDGFPRAVPQRRRRLFVVGCLGSWQRAAAVLLERESLRGDSPPRRTAGQGAPTLPSRGSGGGGLGTDFDCDGGLISPALTGGTGAQTGQDLACGALVARSNGHGSWATDGLAGSLRASDGGGDGALNANLVAGTVSAKWAKGSGGPSGDEAQNLVAYPILEVDGGGTTRGPGPNGVGIGASGDPMFTLQAGKQHAVAFDTTQITHPENRSAPKEGVCHTLPNEAHAPALAMMASGSGQRYTSRHVAEDQTGPGEVLRALRDAADEEAFCQWCLGILAAFWPAEVLRSEVHGEGVRRTALPQRGCLNVALSRAQDGAAWSLLDLWQAGCDGCPPPGWQLHEQQTGELAAYLSGLPYAPSPAERFMRDLWRPCEGSRLLRHALSAVQEARRSTCREGQSVRSRANGHDAESDADVRGSGLHGEIPRERLLQPPRPTGSPGQAAVRRLVVEECEALMGLPRSFTLIPWRGGMAADGPRYKAIGNGQAVNVMRWIGRRIAAVEASDAIASNSEINGFASEASNGEAMTQSF